MDKKEKKLEFEGEVVESLPNTTFRVKLNDTRLVFCHLAGKMRLYHIKVMAGDKVRVEMTPYDETKGRITQRF
ncbi:MAG: translation initiation factor IF-1 [Candidatus Shapirobacteria bacterium]|nr:translation initiation factor IF-1 [Candidatus Shapirobacteria bacterium]